jgi:SagB-type dehydrogenase family enzyme
MKRKVLWAVSLGAVIALAGVGLAVAQEAATVELPKPRTDGGRPLMQVLKDRKSSRAFSTRPLPMETLSDLLWAACGVNRPDGRRTAPTAVNWQEIDVYVAMADGLYLFDARAHALRLVKKEDVRALTGMQSFVREAPVNLIYVADLARMGRASQADKEFYSATDTGFVSQNVYLYCASEGLATVVRGMVDREALSRAMGLRPDQRIVLAQTVGYPSE